MGLLIQSVENFSVSTLPLIINPVVTIFKYVQNYQFVTLKHSVSNTMCHNNATSCGALRYCMDGPRLVLYHAGAKNL